MRDDASWFTEFLDGLAFGLPLFLYSLTSGIEPYWLDSPEFTAAAFELGIPHPPGHPIYAMLANPLTLLPFGTIAFRVSLFSALCGALASWLLFRITLAVTEQAAPRVSPALRSLVSFGAALWASLSVGWWFQSVRAEVYALQIALSLGAVYAFLLWYLRDRPESDGLLLVSFFLFGLGLSNHHFSALAVVPAFGAALLDVGRRRGKGFFRMLLTRGAPAVAAGLLPYLYLPLRTLARPTINLGACDSPSSCFWVVSARAFQRSMEHHYQEGLAERSLHAVYTLMGQVSPVIVVLAAGGLYVLLRMERSWRTGVFLGLLIGVVVLLVSMMGFDPFNPDYYGYTLLAMAGLASSSAALVAVAAGEAASRLERPGAVAGYLFGLVFLAGAAHNGTRGYKESDLHSFEATRTFASWALEDVPPRAVVITHFYKSAFVYWAASILEGARSDIAYVHPPFMGFPGYAGRLLEKEGDLRGLLRGIIATAGVTAQDLAELAQRRPVRMEMDLTIDPSLYRALLPSGTLYEVTSEPMAPNDIKRKAAENRKRWHELYSRLGSTVSEHETWRTLVWYHYLDGIFYAHQGLLEEARESLTLAERLGSESPEINGLLKAVSTAKGPVDVIPFLPMTDHPVPLGLIKEAVEREESKRFGP